MYIHELHDWPGFDWNRERLAQPLAVVRYRQGRLIGRMEALGFNLRQEAVLQTLTEDVLKSSEIEGEKLDAEQELEGLWAAMTSLQPGRVCMAHTNPPTPRGNPLPPPTHFKR